MMSANGSKFWYVTDASLALLGVGLLAVSMRHGAGVGGDATIYLTSAANLAAGRGLGLVDAEGAFRLLPYFPPFFPLLLSFFAAFRLPLAETAQVLNLALFAGLILLAGHQTRQEILHTGLTADGRLAGLGGAAVAAVLAVSPVLIPVYSWAMSEPLAIFLGFAGLVLTVQAVRKPTNPHLLALAAVLSGLGVLTRYINLAFVAAGVLLILLHTPSGKKWMRAALYAILGVLPVAAWVVYDLSQTATVSSRRVEALSSLIGRLADFLPQLRDVFLFWWIPESWVETPWYPAAMNTLLAIFILLVLLAWFAVLTRAARPAYNFAEKQTSDFSPPVSLLAIALAWLIVVYSLLVAFVSATTYPPITIGSRMFSAAHVAALWLVALMVFATLRIFPRILQRRSLTLAVALLAVLFLAVYGLRTVRIVQQNAEVGLGYHSVAWQNSETMAQVRALPAGQGIVTNEEMAVLYLTGRTAYPLAEIYFAEPLESFTAYGQGDRSADRAQQKFHDGQVVLVLFDTIDDQLAQIYGEHTAERLTAFTAGLTRIYRGDDGGIFAAPGLPTLPGQ